MPPCLSSQVPRIATINQSQYVHHLPTELAGWALKMIGAEPGVWVLILSTDASLPAGLAVRGPCGINLTLGLTALNVDQMEEVKAMSTVVIAKVKQCCRLHGIRYRGHSSSGRERVCIVCTMCWVSGAIACHHTVPSPVLLGSLTRKDDPGSSVAHQLLQHRPLNVSGRLTKKAVQELGDTDESDSSESDTVSEGTDDGRRTKAKPETKKAPPKKKAPAATSTASTAGSSASKRKARTDSQPPSREASTEREETQDKKVKKTGSLKKLKDAAGGNK